MVLEQGCAVRYMLQAELPLHRCRGSHPASVCSGSLTWALHFSALSQHRRRSSTWVISSPMSQAPRVTSSLANL